MHAQTATIQHNAVPKLYDNPYDEGAILGSDTEDEEEGEEEEEEEDYYQISRTHRWMKRNSFLQVVKVD